MPAITFKRKIIISWAELRPEFLKKEIFVTNQENKTR
jgi:hypothetical protein